MGACFAVKNANSGRSLGTRIAIAGDSQTRRVGLLGREDLTEGAGLWISPCEAVHTFGMRFALDVVFLDSGRRVVKQQKHLSPFRLAMCLCAESVLELPSGAIEQSRTRVGDQLVFYTPAEDPVVL